MVHPEVCLPLFLPTECRSSLSVSMATATVFIMLVIVLGGLCDLSVARRSLNVTESPVRPRRQAVHVHKHTSGTRHSQSSTYIKEEGKYFLKKIFEKYGHGEKEILLADFELLLGRIGFEPERVDDAHGHVMEEHEGPEHQVVRDLEPGASTEKGGHGDGEGGGNTHVKHGVDNASRDHENSGHGEKVKRGHGGHGQKGHQSKSDPDHAGGTGHHTNKGRSTRVRRDLQTRHRKASRDFPRLGSGPDAQSVVIHTHDLHTECLSVQQLIQLYHADERGKIGKKDFLFMSPAIVYQLDNPHCRRRHDEIHHRHVAPTSTVPAAARVWGYSTAAVVVISLVGLLGVAVIPIMQKFFFNQLLQFLVAMAVGALTGDAMLHLLPHAIAGGETAAGADKDHDHDHLDSVWKGLCGLLGIYFFFIVQRLMVILTGARNRRMERKKAKAKHAFSDEPDLSAVAVKLSSYSESDSEEDGDMVTTVNSESQAEQAVPLKQETTQKVRGQSATGHSRSGHGHSHIDGPLPATVSAVAWMVILGDGVHNFSDGLAIGAAFANSITGGISTAIAVFCHELPHEIGDFAVLLKAGMSIKQAVVYNCLSSVLCFVGMLIGVALGNIEEASMWIFASVGGMFIYISLVTMVPELTSMDTQNPLRDLFLQCVGVCVGSGIMLTIAVYEEDLLNVLG
ncbi:zinc transporter ZIP10-like [Haliotis rufescens]|uniref:zinc transporter ZIP10-like n=1 Tax=Haliotis rufescens TaxID=6454 RepID=UPI00201EA5BB|nr:zinc transporter ZIP10-like [Haliotis rufescens]